METVEANVVNHEELVGFIFESTGIESEDIEKVLESEFTFLNKKGLIYEGQGLLSVQGMTREFHELFGHPIASHPAPMDITRATNRAKWTAEEIIEFLGASASSKEEFSKAYYAFKDGIEKVFLKTLEDNHFEMTNLERIVAQVDALGDANYFINGSSVEIGFNLELATGIIHEANLSKLFIDEEGNKYAKYREDGKVLKSPQFYGPEENLTKYIQEISGE